MAFIHPLLFLVAVLYLSHFHLTNAFSSPVTKSRGNLAAVRSTGFKIISSIHQLALLRQLGLISYLESSSSSTSEKPGHSGETLLKISFALNSAGKEAEATDILQSYIASFPFSAVLPVQPLTYIPRKEGNGVTVSFLRKKTQEKGSIDGGIEFVISSSHGPDGSVTINLVAIRNEEGQSISKVFSEGLIIKSLVSGLYGEGGYVGKGKEKLFEVLNMEKVIHKWM